MWTRRHVRPRTLNSNREHEQEDQIYTRLPGSGLPPGMTMVSDSSGHSMDTLTS